MKKCGIYSITQISTGKRYIGSSVNIKRRWYSHKSALRRNIADNIHLQNAWNKYGSEDFIFEIIEENLYIEILEDRENYYIEKFGIADRQTNIFDNNKGFNMFWAGREGCANSVNVKRGVEHYAYGKPGLRRGMKMPEDFCRKHSERMTGAPGRHKTPHTEESKQKMRDKMKNRPWSEARREAQNKKRNII